MDRKPFDGQVGIRRLDAGDLDEADRIMRLAFGTFTGLADPMAFMGDAAYVHSRFRADPEGAFGLVADGRLAGSNFATCRGRFGFVGPLSVDPALWGNGFAHRLMVAVIDRLDRCGVALCGLMTFAHSVQHIRLYEHHGFRARALTLLMEKDLTEGLPADLPDNTYAGLDVPKRRAALDCCRRLTDAIYPGLDPCAEIVSIFDQQLGDTVLIWDNNRLAALAACHVGAGSEAGTGNCYIKFGAAMPGSGAARRFERLLAGCARLGAGAGATRLVAGINVARTDAYEILRKAGFTAFRTGIAMHRPNQQGFNRPGAFVIDDWR